MSESPFDTEFGVGRVVAAEPFPEANTPELMKLEIDLGDREVRSAAQLGYNYEPGDVEGRQVVCATNLGTVSVAGYESEVLTVGVPDADGHPVLVAPEREVPEGGRLY